MFHNMQLPIQLYRWYKITSQLFWLKMIKNSMKEDDEFSILLVQICLSYIDYGHTIIKLYDWKLRSY